MKAQLLIGALQLLTCPVFSQQGGTGKPATTRPATGDMPLADALKLLKQRFGTDILFEDNIVKGLRVPASQVRSGSDLPGTLDVLLKPLSLTYRKVNDKTFVVVPVKRNQQQGGDPGQKSGLLAAAQGTVGNDGQLANGDRRDPSFAQTSTARDTIIKGVVTNDQGAPLPGASVKEKNGSNMVAANAAGEFRIAVASAQAELVVSFMGYQSKELTASGTQPLRVALSPGNSELEEVAVIGYGTVKRKDLTGSVGEVKMDDLKKAPVPSFDAALAGRVAGVTVSSVDGQPGSSNIITIRGGNSLTQDNSPLYVVDGFPIENPNNNAINPADIESIDVLKDASATAIYGARGANGVIIITTKKGKAGAPVVTLNSWYGIQRNIRQQELMSPYEFVKYQTELNPTLFNPLYLSNGKTLDSYKNVEGINWQDKILRTAAVSSNSISVRGGNDKTKYFVSGSLFDQKGIILGGGFKRAQARVNLDQIVNPNVKFGINANYNYSRTYGQVALASTENNISSYLFYNAWGYRPVTGDSAQDANFLEMPFDEDVTSSVDVRVNPYQIATNAYNYSFNYGLYTNSYIEYKFLKNFTLRVTGGVSLSDVRYETFNNSKSPAGNPRTLYGRVNGMNGSISNNKVINLVNENTLTYNKTINRNNVINAVGGFSMQRVKLSADGFSAIQVPNESLGIAGLDEGTPTFVSSSASESILASFFGRFNYTYRGKYLLTASMRADGSSRFSPNNRWGYFPSAAFAWKLGEEKFMRKLGFVSDAKVRLSHGFTGNNRVSDYAYLSVLRQNVAFNSGNTGSGYYFNGVYVPGSVPTEVGNEDLKWETTVQTDLGVNLAVLNNRVELVADVYRKKTKDLLLLASLASSTGYATGYKNIGSIENKGLELTLNIVNVKTRDFTWSSTFNIAFNRNKILELNENQPSLTTRVYWNDNFNNSLPYLAKPGRPVALFYGFLFDGIYQTGDFNQLPNGTYSLKDDVVNNGMDRSQIQPGFIRYKDVNGDGVVDANDQAVIGNPQPIHTGGFSNNFRYGNFDLNVFFQWSYGNDILNGNRIIFEGSEGRPFLNMFKSMENRWSPQNASNLLPKTGGYGPNVYSSRTIEDGSFLRLKTVALGYTLPESLLKKIKMKSIRAYASAQNLVTWTKYSGLDPEVSVRNSALTPGFDFSSYPKARTVTLGLDITF